MSGDGAGLLPSRDLRRPEAVSCCETNAAGKTRCRVRRDAAHCVAPHGGTACASVHPSCCDACTAGGCAPPSCGPACLARIKTVFLILMENHNWEDIFGNTTSAPYMNGTLLPMASYATQYYNPPSLHPSLPNYLWL